MRSSTAIQINTQKFSTGVIATINSKDMNPNNDEVVQVVQVVEDNANPNVIKDTTDNKMLPELSKKLNERDAGLELVDLDVTTTFFNADFSVQTKDTV